MDYRNNPRHDRKLFLEKIREQAIEYISNTPPHDTIVYIDVPDFKLSPDSFDLYGSFSVFLFANRRKILEQFVKYDWPNGVIVQLSIGYKTSLSFSWYNQF